LIETNPRSIPGKVIAKLVVLVSNDDNFTNC